MSVIAPREPLRPLDIGQTKQAMAIYQQGLQAILADNDWQQFVDRRGNRHKFLKRSGWRKIALWFGLNLETQREEIDRDVNGHPLRARVVYRAIASDGRYADGEGGCDTTERNIQKPEHDLLATAATRAVNRAISNLVGLGEVSADEIEAEPEGATVVSPFGPLADAKLVGEARDVVAALYPDGDAEAFITVLSRTFDDGLPEVAARALKGLGWWIGQEEAKQGRSEPESAAETPSEGDPEPESEPEGEVAA